MNGWETRHQNVDQLTNQQVDWNQIFVFRLPSFMYSFCCFQVLFKWKMRLRKTCVMWVNQDWLNPVFHNIIINMKHDSVVSFFSVAWELNDLCSVLAESFLNSPHVLLQKDILVRLHILQHPLEDILTPATELCSTLSSRTYRDLHGVSDC